MPTFNPAAGTYTSSQQVTLSDTTPGATIYYTTNGAAPTTGSTPYTGAIPVTSTETIEAIAVAGGYTPSAVAAATYTIAIAETGNADWVWMAGSNGTDVAGVYGTLGAFSGGSFPGARDSAVTWVDSAGNFWLFGGESYTPSSGTFDFNDLWELNPATAEWAWMGGGTAIDAAGVYGTQGTASVNNIPSARSGGVSWIDTGGNLWLFGGYYPNIYGNAGDFYNDLWEFNPNTKEWTWIDGSSAPNASGTYGALGSASATGVPGARFGAVSWTDRNGRFWLFGGEGYDSAGAVVMLNDLWEFNPASKQWTWVSGSNLIQTSGVYGTQGVASAGNVPGGRYSSSGWTDSSGNLWLFGGQGYGKISEFLYNDLWMFNPATQEWTWMSGNNSQNAAGVYGTQGVASAGNAPGARYFSTNWTDARGNLWLLGGAGYDASHTFNWLNDLWEFNPNTREWTWMSGSNIANASGVYGSLGVASPSNVPGARVSPNNWTDSSGNLWLFGGLGNTVNNSAGNLNDLWRYQP